MAHTPFRLGTALLSAVLAASGCGGSGETATQPATGAQPSTASATTEPGTPSALPGTPLTTPHSTGVQALVWEEILDLPLDDGQFTVQRSPLLGTYLSVLRNGVEVGQVFSRAYSDLALAEVGADQGGTADGLLPYAQAYIEHLEALAHQQHPTATFRPVTPTKFSFGTGDGVRLGWTVEDGGEVIQQFAIFLIQMPGAIQWFQAGFDPADPKQASFRRYQDLDDFLPSLDEVMAAAKLPVSN